MLLYWGGGGLVVPPPLPLHFDFIAFMQSAQRGNKRLLRCAGDQGFGQGEREQQLLLTCMHLSTILWVRPSDFFLALLILLETQAVKIRPSLSFIPPLPTPGLPASWDNVPPESREQTKPCCSTGRDGHQSSTPATRRTDTRSWCY